MRPPVLALVLIAALSTAGARAEPFLVAEADFGTLEVVALADFDPPPAGEALPPEDAYWSFSSFEPLPVEDREAAAAEVLRRARESRDALAGRGLVAADHAEIEQLSPREFVLVVAHVTRSAIRVPLTPPGVDDQNLEQFLADGLGVCRHLSVVGEAVAELLRPACPAARDVRITGYGDHHTHSWLRAAAMVPDGDGWRLVETHLDLTSHTPEQLFERTDLLVPEKLQRYPLAALALQRAGLNDGAATEFDAFLQRPGTLNRAAAWTELFHARLVAGRWEGARRAAAQALEALDEEQRTWDRRAIPTTPDQLLEMRLAIHLAFEALHDADPEGWEGAGLPAPERWVPEVERLTALYDALSAYAFQLEGDLAGLELEAARARMEREAAAAGGDAWAYRAAYAAVLQRAKAPFRAHGDTALLLELAVERHELLPDDEIAAADLANSLLGRVDDLERRGLVPTARDLALLAAHDGALPEGIPESHLVRAWVAGRSGNAGAQRRAYRSVIETCDALPEAAMSPREEAFRILALVELERLAADEGRLAEAEGHARDALAALQAASPGLRDDPARHEPLAVLWWDAGIRLTIADSNPALAVEIWRAFVAWDPADPRARYGLARGLVQQAIAELEAEDDGAVATAREAVRALRDAAGLEVPVPRSGEFLRLAWFNLATRFESHGELALALEIARGQAKALPDEPAGSILVARTLGLMAAGARGEEACVAAVPHLEEGETLLAWLPPLPLEGDHLRASAVNAYRSLAIGAATCGDAERALGLVEAGLDRFPEEPGLAELRDQLAAQPGG